MQTTTSIVRNNLRDNRVRPTLDIMNTIFNPCNVLHDMILLIYLYVLNILYAQKGTCHINPGTLCRRWVHAYILFHPVVPWRSRVLTGTDANLTFYILLTSWNTEHHNYILITMTGVALRLYPNTPNVLSALARAYKKAEFHGKVGPWNIDIVWRGLAAYLLGPACLP